MVTLTDHRCVRVRRPRTRKTARPRTRDARPGARGWDLEIGKPMQNAYAERFGRTVRHEWLDLHDSEGVEHAQKLASE